MGILSWALNRRDNATADPTMPAADGASARTIMDLLRGVMAAARALADDQGGAIATAGTGNAYVVSTASGVTQLRAGLSFLVKVDRTNTDAASLNVDGTGPKPWRDQGNQNFAPGHLPAERFLRVTYDAARGAWLSDLFVDEGGVAALGTALSALTTAANNHINSAANPHNVTKAQVGLGSVANLAPLDLPVSTATAAAIAAAALSSALGAPGYNKLVDLDLSLPDKSLVQVLYDGANNGLYRKVGAPGTGSFELLDAVTLIALAAKTRFLSVGDGGRFLVIRDANRRRLASLELDGTLIAKLGIDIGVSNGLSWTRLANGRYRLDLGTAEGKLPIGPLTIDTTGSTVEGDIARWRIRGRRVLRLDSAGAFTGKFINLLPAAPSPETAAARGSRDSLNARLDQSLTPYGMPREATWGLWFLREFRQRTRKRALLESLQCCVALIGDSFTHNATRYSGTVASTLISLFGDAGGGWVGFGSNAGLDNGNVRPSLYTYTRPAGTWTFTYGTSPSPDICHANSSVAGSRIRLTGPTTPALSKARLFWVATADGVMRYSWDGGTTWLTRPVQGTVGSLQTADLDLTGIPASATFELLLEVVSGTCSPAGIDLQSLADGVRVHKIAATGSRAAQWASVPAADWQAGLALLGPNLVTILHGTNDQGNSRTPDQYAADLATIIDRVRVACPFADILIILPPENGRSGMAYPMSAYAAAGYVVAAQKKCAFIDLQYYFGETFDQYSPTSGRPWFNVDLIHPEPLTGGRAIADAILRALLYS